MIDLIVAWWISKGEQRVLLSLLRHLSTSKGLLKWMKTSIASENALPNSLFYLLFPLLVNLIVETHFA